MQSNNNIPSVDLLNATHKFPGTYVFKAVGLHDQAFVPRVVAAVREELRLASDPPYVLRESKGARHVAVTLSVFVDSAEAVRGVYTRLLKVEGLAILL